MNDAQVRQADAIRQAFNQMHAMLTPPKDTPVTPEAGRLFSVARTQLELSCMAAVKAVSRMV
jgi:hypothetical protein